MKKHIKKVSLFMGILYLTTLSGCTNVDKSPQKPEARGFIWSATKDGKEVKLVGTMHPSPTTHKLLTEDIVNILKETDVLSVEVDMTINENVEKVQKSMYLKNGESIEKYLSENEIEKLQDIAKENGMTYGSMKYFNSTGLAQVITSIYTSKAGYTGTALDSLMIDWAKSNSVDINSLEAVDFQIETMNKLFTWEVAKNEINSYSKETMDSTIKYSTQLFDDYVKGDEVNAISLVDDMKKNNSNEYKFLVLERNVEMVNSIEKLMQNNKRNTVAVGYRHYIGEDSILKMLEDKGFEIKRIN